MHNPIQEAVYGVDGPAWDDNLTQPSVNGTFLLAHSDASGNL